MGITHVARVRITGVLDEHVYEDECLVAPEILTRLCRKNVDLKPTAIIDAALIALEMRQNDK